MARFVGLMFGFSLIWWIVVTFVPILESLPNSHETTSCESFGRVKNYLRTTPEFGSLNSTPTLEGRTPVSPFLHRIMPTSAEPSGCFGCFRFLKRDKFAYPKARRLPIRAHGTGAADYSPCISELESLLSATERRSARIVFSYLSVLKPGEELKEGAKIAGVHEAWDPEKGLKEGVGIEKEVLRVSRWAIMRREGCLLMFVGL